MCNQAHHGATPSTWTQAQALMYFASIHLYSMHLTGPADWRTLWNEHLHLRPHTWCCLSQLSWPQRPCPAFLCCHCKQNIRVFRVVVPSMDIAVMQSCLACNPLACLVLTCRGGGARRQARKQRPGTPAAQCQPEADVCRRGPK